MKFFCKATALSFLAAAVLALVACGGDSGSSSPDNSGETGVTSVTLSASNNATVTVGETITLTATPNATPTSNQYRWTVSNATVAQLNNSSDTTITTSSNTVTLKGVKAGTVSVTVTVDGVKSNTLSVTVNASAPAAPTLQDVTISGGGEIEATGTATLEASPTFTTTPTSDTTTYVWAIIKVDGTTASLSDYATLTPNGKTATLQANNTTNKEHTITVQVTATYNGKPKFNTVTVTIAAQGETVQNKLTGLTLVPEATSLNPNKDTVLTAAATYSGTVSLSYEWKIIKVDGKDVTDDTSAYATLSDGTDGHNSRAATTEHKYNTLTNTNTTVDDHVITVQLTAINTADPTNYITRMAGITVKGAKITGIAIEADKETISSDGKATLTADVATTDDSVEYEVTWAITAVNGTAANATDYATLQTNEDGTATLTGKNTSGAKLTVAITATATNKNDNTNTEDTPKTITIAREGVSAAYYPLSDEEAAYADTYLEITFDSAPTINRASSGSVRIYKKGGTLVDTIKPAAEKLYGYGVDGNSSYGEINAQYQLIQVINEKTVRIIPHHGTTVQKATLLENGTEYYVLIDNGLITGTVDGKAFAGITDATAWTFKTGAAPNVSGNTLTVGKDKQFVTVQGALSYLMANSKTGDWQINIDKGTYYERIFYSGNANITMSGQGSATYGTDVEIQWCNQDGGESTTLWNTGSRGRNVFYFAGGNLILENLSLVNTATRKSNEYGEHDDSATSDNANGNNQAEALLFDSTGTCAAYNCNFTSKQDTVYLSPSGGKAWFYGCKISGDVDFIWGLSNVALFEKCNIISAYDADKSSNHVTYVVASHLKNSSAPYGKGFVVYNSTITTESEQTTYLARSPWGKEDDDKQIAQVAIIDTAVTGGLASSPWYGNHVGGTDETILGWKWYNVTSDGSEIGSTYKITQAQYEAEFAGRRNILNRVYNGSAFEKDSTSYWDISSLLARWGIAECGSKETLTGETEVTSVVYDFTAITGVTQWNSISSVAATGDSTNTASLTGFRWHSATYGANTNTANATATIPVTGACTVTVYNSYTSDTDVSLKVSGSSTVLASGTAEKNSSCTLSYTTNSATDLVVTIAASGTYISKIIVTYTSDGTTTDPEPGNTSNGTTADDSAVIKDNGAAISDTDSYSRSNTLTITKGEKPTGYAGVDYVSPSYTDTVHVSTKADFKHYAELGGYFIIVDGMIDLSEGMLPSVGGGTTEALDAFVKTNSSYSKYSEWVAAYAAACSLTSDDEKENSSINTNLYSTLWALSGAYQSVIQIAVASNTAIVGNDASSGIKGGNLSINNVSNVVIRNLTIQDAYDPFPHHEQKNSTTSDGYNAQYDCITVQGNCSYIWLDHCTVQDTMSVGHVYTGGASGTEEKWQTYDGLIDLKGTAKYITVSYCKFKNHDKTCLLGSSDDEGNNADDRRITYHHNYFYNCGQRLPMMRNGTFHLYNNYYDYSNGPYNQQYAMGVRAGSKVYAESNTFTSGIYYAFAAESSSVGTLYEANNTISGTKFGKALTASSGSTLFSSAVNAYTYNVSADAASNVPSLAGTGAVSIKDATFASTTKNISNDTATLGLTAATVSSNKTSVATADISGSNIVITSEAAGETTITATDSGSNTVTIPVTVDAMGTIFIGSFEKYSATKFTVSWLDSQDHSTTTGACTDGNGSVAKGGALSVSTGTVNNTSYGSWAYNSGKIPSGTSGGLTFTTTTKVPAGFDTIYIDFPVTAVTACSIKKITVTYGSHGTDKPRGQISYKTGSNTTFTTIVTDSATNKDATNNYSTDISLTANETVTIRVALGDPSASGGIDASKSPTICTVVVTGE